MADILRIKRRTSGGVGAPASLANAEVAYNEVDHILYYGEGTGGAGGTASVIAPIGGQGLAFNGAPVMNSGTIGNSGTQGVWARGDHTHPVDTSRAAASAIPAVSTILPSVDIGTGVVGTLTTYARGDHQHPVDGSRAPLDNPIFTGDPRAPTPLNTDSDTSIATTAFVKGQRLDQFVAPTSAVSMNSQYITNLRSPNLPADAATKSYVDSIATGLSVHNAVAVATVGSNISLSTLQTIDGYSIQANDRVLVKDQTASQDNGIYTAVAGAWTRVSDMDAWSEVPNAYVFVSNGTINATSSWVCNSGIGGTLGTTPITWVQFSPPQAQVTAGAGLVRTGNQFDVVGVSGQIIANADNIGIDTGYVGQPSITTLGTIGTGTWNAITIAVNKGGTGGTTFAAGYVKANGTAAFTTSASIPNTDVAGLGNMAFQNSTTVDITGGTINGITFDMGTF